MTSKDTDRDVRKLALSRELIALWMGLFKALRLYDWQHAAIQSLAERIRDKVNEISEGPGTVAITVRSDSIFIDGARVRESSAIALSYVGVVKVFYAARVDSCRIDADVGPEEIQVFGHLLLALSEGLSSPEELLREMKVRGATNIEITIYTGRQQPADEVDSKELQKRMYLRSIGVLKSVFHEAHAKDQINARRVKRSVQQMIDTIDSDPSYMLTLTSVKNYDEYTFNHSVNVGVLSIALGRAVGLSRRQLYVVGQAGLLHDLGKLCVPREVLNKPGRLTPEEREKIRAHPTEGFFSIATKMGVSPDTITVALGAYEHHLNLDGSGYPDPASQRPVGLLSRVIAIVDRFDAMTSARIYRKAPIPPTKALSILFHSQRAHVDQALLRYFMNIIGYYPLGTAVRLSDNSVAIVVGSASDDSLRHFPVVKIVLDESGHAGSGDTVDLAANLKGPDLLHVVETLNASDYGIEAMDYIL
jgi:HD-GYP domain-containing protein (c-di-GMP phosphodiesterase class II)